MSLQNTLNANLDGAIFSKEQKQFYAQNGYVVVKKLIDPDSILRYTDRFLEICKGSVKTSQIMILMRDVTLVKSGKKEIKENTLTKITNFTEDEVLWDYCKQPKIIDAVKDLIANNEDPCILAMNTMVINKPPDQGEMSSRHPLHQDLHYFPFRPANHICAAWTAMEHISRKNGCLVVVPGSHLGPLMEHGYPDWGEVNSVYHGIKNYSPDMKLVHLEMDIGDTVFFHPLLIHGSGANKTAGYRKAITCHFANDNLCYYVKTENESGDMLKKEFQEIFQKYFKKKGMDGAELSYQDFWSIRAKEVIGNRSNL